MNARLKQAVLYLPMKRGSMFRKLIAPALALTVATPLTFATTSAEAAAPAVKFARFQADAPGNDNSPTNASLNTEYIVITNTTSKTVTIGGYRVSDNGSKHVFRVPAGFKLGAKKSVTLRSGKGTNTSTNLYWGQSVRGAKPVARNGFVWNNSGDTATLRNASGAVLHVCKYTKNKAGYKSC